MRPKAAVLPEGGVTLIFFRARPGAGGKICYQGQADPLYLVATTGPAHIPLNSIFGRPPPSTRQRQRTLVSLYRLRRGRCAEHGVGVERLCINQLKSNMVEVKTGATTSHVCIDIDNGVIITSAITNEGVAELNLKRR